jgi:hypothetical protein
MDTADFASTISDEKSRLQSYIRPVDGVTLTPGLYEIRRRGPI